MNKYLQTYQLTHLHTKRMSNDLLQRAKGVRDFGPAEKIKREKVITQLKKTFESFGYSPLETPIIERYELFASKFGQGEQSEAMQESFKLEDQGKRKLVLRNEFTIPLARYVGMNPEIKFPFKRYQIGDVFRDGPLKLGRYREFYQCDIDVVGSMNLAFDAEMLRVAQQFFKSINLSVNIYFNNRKLLNSILSFFGVEETNLIESIISIDKLEKIGPEGVAKDLDEKNIQVNNLKDILDLLNTKGTNEEKISAIENVIGDCVGLGEVKQTINNLPDQSDIVFLPSLARGLAYYTGDVFEVFLKDTNIMNSALAGGGRYDEMIGGFLESKEDIGALGISFGLEAIIDVLNKLNPEETIQTVTQIYVCPIGEENISKSIQISDEIRALGFNVDMDLQNRKLKKNLEYCNSLNIPYVVILGSDELEQKKLMLRDLRSGEQSLITLDELKNKIII